MSTYRHNHLSIRHHFLAGHYNYPTSWHIYMTSRHNFLARRHNIWQGNFTIWQLDFIIWMLIFFKQATFFLFCVDFTRNLSIPTLYIHSYKIVSAMAYKLMQWITSTFPLILLLRSFMIWTSHPNIFFDIYIQSNVSKFI